MKAEDLKAKTPDELTKILMDARKEQMNLRFQRAGGQLEKTDQIRKVRRNIARIKTALSVQQKPAAAAKPAAPKKATAKKAAKKSGEKAA